MGFEEGRYLNLTLTHRENKDIWKCERSALVYSVWVEAEG